MRKSTMTMIAAAIVMNASAAVAGVAPAIKCNATKNKLVGAYYACRLKADATAAVKGGSADYAKCITKFNEKWNKVEMASDTACPDNYPISADMDEYLIGQSTQASGILAGTEDIPTEPTPPVCGDGTINAAGEHCDGSAMGDLTCATFGKFGTLGCTAGCKADLSGCSECPTVGLVESYPYEGSCWVLGDLGASCDTACASVGLVYDTATETVSGSSGTDAHCLSLLYAFDTPGGDLDNPGGPCSLGASAGCMVLPGSGYRARCGTPATTSSYSHASAQRVCACH